MTFRQWFSRWPHHMRVFQEDDHIIEEIWNAGRSEGYAAAKEQAAGSIDSDLLEWAYVGSGENEYSVVDGEATLARIVAAIRAMEPKEEQGCAFSGKR